jgi:hypothetical protein
MKLTSELIEAYLDGSLAPSQTAKLDLWLKSRPKDAARVKRQKALREALKQSAPQLSAAQSRQLWADIRAKAQAEAAPVPVLDFREPWYAFIFRPWGSAGMVTAALALVALAWHPWTTQSGVAPLTPSAPVAQAIAAPAAPKAAVASKPGISVARKITPPVMAQASQPSPAVAVADAAAPAANEPTEVERALADSGVDGMIDAYLSAQRQPGAMRASNVESQRQGFDRSSLNSPLAGLTQSSEQPGPDLSGAPQSAAQGAPDKDGFWNWTPAALALNRRDWPQAQVELQAARSHATESAERDFAGSALTLLSAPGAPLAGQDDGLPADGELRVLGAGRWQLLVDNRLARFSEGVSVRLPGFRAEGDSLLLDLTFDRATFAPGTRFTRLAGETPAAVLDAQGVAVSSDEFNAPSGATYNVSQHQLKLR